MLIGHSCGAGFIVRWLSERTDSKVDKVVLVAPWLNPEDNPRSETGDFFHFAIDPKLIDRTNGITIFHSDNDKPTILKSVQIIRDTIPSVKYRQFPGYGHFCEEDMGTTHFPALLEEILGA
jgi:predicted alpha/beta hydrolase family esterase